MELNYIKPEWGFNVVQVGSTTIHTCKLRMLNLHEDQLIRLVALKNKYPSNMLLTVIVDREHGSKVLVGYTTAIAAYAHNMKKIIGDVLKQHAQKRHNERYAWVDKLKNVKQLPINFLSA